LRVTGEDSSYSRNDHNGFSAHLVLRDTPGHSREHHRSLRRDHRLARLRLRESRPATAAADRGRGVARATRDRRGGGERADTAASPACCRSPTRASGWNQRRHTEHGRFFVTASATIAGRQRRGPAHHPTRVISREHPGHFSRAAKQVERKVST